MKQYLNKIIFVILIVVLVWALGNVRLGDREDHFQTDLTVEVVYQVQNRHLYYYEGNDYNIHLIGIDELTILNDGKKTLKDYVSDDEGYIDTFLSKLKVSYEGEESLHYEFNTGKGEGFYVIKCKNDLYIINVNVNLTGGDICSSSVPLKVFGEVISIGEETVVALSKPIGEKKTLSISNNGYKIGDVLMITYTMKNKPIIEIQDVFYINFSQYKVNDFGIQIDVPYAFIIKNKDNIRMDDYYEYYLEYFKRCDCLKMNNSNRGIKIYFPNHLTLSSVVSTNYQEVNYLKKGQFITFHKNDEPIYVTFRNKDYESITIAF